MTEWIIEEADIKTEPESVAHFVVNSSESEVDVKLEPEESESAEVAEHCENFADVKEEAEETFEKLPLDIQRLLDDEYDSDDEDDGCGPGTSSQAAPITKRGRKEAQQTYVCLTCGYMACSELDRQEHMAVKHQEVKMKDIENEAKFLCNYCGRSFKSRFNQMKHRLVIHDNE